MMPGAWRQSIRPRLRVGNRTMDRLEFRAASSLAAVFSVRLLGLFMIYPVFAAYARDLSGATPYLIGEALGIYGLSQGLLQIPFGLLSDRLGRKRMIVIGLILFGIGSAVAAISHLDRRRHRRPRAAGRRRHRLGDPRAGGRSDGGGEPHQGHGHGRHHHRRLLHGRAGGRADRCAFYRRQRHLLADGRARRGRHRDHAIRGAEPARSASTAMPRPCRP